MNWRTINRALYQAHLRTSQLGLARLGRRAAERTILPEEPTDEPRPVLYVSWGRLGDAALGTAITRNLRRWFDRPVVVLGRAETADVVRDHVDRFVGFSPDRWLEDEWYRRHFALGALGEYDTILGDVHLFHGGGPILNDLIDRLPARHKFVYEGYAPRDRLAGNRTFPATAECIPALRKSDHVVAGRHVWHDMVHYLTEVLIRSGRAADDVSEAARPALSFAEAPDCGTVLESFQLERHGFVACQPFANNRIKDVTATAWRDLFRAFPDRTFVLLGGPADAHRSGTLEAPNVVDLCGHTTLGEAARVVAGARLFVGPDSGLTHIAACLGQRTVCISQSANLGYFFPHPTRWEHDHLRVVHNGDYETCSGCLTSCEHEPIWRTAREGVRCLRTLPAAAILEAVGEELDRPLAQPTPARVG